jgi:hypothetical protein
MEKTKNAGFHEETRHVVFAARKGNVALQCGMFQRE